MGMLDELSKQTNYLVDFRRTSSLFFSHHHYSTKEWLERGFVLTSSAGLGFLNWMQSEEGGTAPFAYGAGLGFLISNTITMSPLIHKCVVSMWNFSTVAKEIKANIADDSPEFISLVNGVIKQVKAYEGSRSASVIWRKREILINNLSNWLNNYDHIYLKEALKSSNIVEELADPAGPSRELSAIKKSS